MIHILKVPATITGVKTMRDKTLRIQCDTQELTPEDKAKIMDLHEQLGYFVFAPVEREIREDDLKDLPKIPEDKDIKSPSKQLYDRLFVYYKQTHKTAEGFYIWYSNEVEKIGQEYLNKLL